MHRRDTVAGLVDEITPNGVKLDNGKKLPADVIVYATGYGSMIKQVYCRDPKT